MNLKKLLPLLLLAPLGAVALFVLFEWTLAYHSPFYNAAAEPRTPRMQAFIDLEETARKKAEDEAARAELLANLTAEKMADLGKEIVHGRGLCFNCHAVGSEGGGTQGPNLLDVGVRASSRVEGLSGVEYLTQSLYLPEAFVVEGYVPSMTPANESPISLNDDEILWVVAYLQTLGGELTVEPSTELPRPPP